MSGGKAVPSFVHYVQEAYRPIVMTVASPEVDRLCQKNHLSFTELLRPLGHQLEGVGMISFRTSKSYNLKNFGVRFVSAAEITTLDTKVADKYLDGVIRSSAPAANRMEDSVRDGLDVNGFWRVTSDATPWFSRYRHEFIETLRFSEYDFVDQPVACLFAVAASDENPIAQMEGMRQVRHYPPLLQAGAYDRDMLHKMYVVVHDNQSANPNSLDNAGKILRELRKLYGEANCKLIQINSNAANKPDLAQRDIWASHLHPSRGILSLLQPAANGDVKGDSKSSVKPNGAATAATAASPTAASAAAASSAIGNSINNPLGPLMSSPTPAGTGGAATASTTAVTVPVAQIRGCYLSKPDLDRLSSLLGDFILKGILPHLEKKIATLQEKIALARKGFRNQMKLMFGRRETKLKPATTPSGGAAAAASGANAASGGANNTTTTYELTSVEAQIRTLADLCFVLQDYDGALTNYKLVAADNKEDKAWRCYAGAQEMMALCVAMIEVTSGSVAAAAVAGVGGAAAAAASQQQIREMIGYFDAAYQSFMSIGDIPRATRVTLRAVEILRYYPAHIRDCSNYLLRSSEKESGLRGALLLEQAAYMFLLMRPTPLVRKYAFHLVMAGHLYHKANQKLHGVRCYMSACAVYEERGWFHVEDHIHFNLGRDCFNLGHFQQSVQFFVRLIAKQGATWNTQTGAMTVPTSAAAWSAITKDTIERQKTFLQEFIYVVKKWSGGKPREVPNLKLPLFLDSSVQVILNDTQTIPSSMTQSSWDAAIAMKPPMSLNTKECNRPLFALDDKSDYDTQRTCVVREPIYVRVTMVNKLQVDVTVSRLQLRCVHEPTPVPAAAAGGNTTAPAAEPVITTTSCDDIPSPDSILAVDSQNIVLGPNAVRTVELKVVCRAEGTVRIEGISWEVCDSLIRGFHRFALPDRSVTTKKGRRRLTKIMPNQSWIVPITPPLPLLSFEFVNFPASMLHGECAYGALRLVNFGQIALDQLAVKISHPAFIVIPKLSQSAAIAAASASAESKDAATAATAAAASGAMSGNIRCYDYDWKTGVIDLGLQLEPGESVLLPLWIRAASAGEQNIGFLFRYQAKSGGRGEGAAASVKPSSASPFRVAHLQRTIQVSPLFNAKIFNRPGFSNLKESILGVEIERMADVNSSPGSVFDAKSDQNTALVVTNIAVWSRAWQISPLGNKSAPSALPPPALLPSYVSPSAPVRSTQTINSAASASTALSPFGNADPLASAQSLYPNESTTLYFRVCNLPPATGSSIAASGSSSLAASSASTPSGTGSSTPAAMFTFAPHSIATAASSESGGEPAATPSTPGTPSAAIVVAPSPSSAAAAVFAAGMHNPLKPVWKDQLLQPTHHSSLVFTEVPFVSDISAELSLPPARPQVASSGAAAAASSAVAPTSGSGVVARSVPVRCEHRPFIDLLGMEKDLLIENEQHRIQMNPAAIVAHVNASDRLDVCVSWCSTDRKRFGFHYLPGQACMKTPPSACSLKVALHYPRAVSHAFNARSGGGLPTPLVVPIQIRIRNVLDDRPVSFLFETLPPEEEFDSNKRAFRTVQSSALSSSSGRYLWRGTTRQTVQFLPPNHTTCVELSAVFYHSGAYNLNRFRFTVETHGVIRPPVHVPGAGSAAAQAAAAAAAAATNKRVFFFPLQHLISVVGSGPSAASASPPAAAAIFELPDASPLAITPPVAVTPAVTVSAPAVSTVTAPATPPRAVERTIPSTPAAPTAVAAAAVPATPTVDLGDGESADDILAMFPPAAVAAAAASSTGFTPLKDLLPSASTTPAAAAAGGAATASANDIFDLLSTPARVIPTTPTVVADHKAAPATAAAATVTAESLLEDLMASPAMAASAISLTPAPATSTAAATPFTVAAAADSSSPAPVVDTAAVATATAGDADPEPQTPPSVNRAGDSLSVPTGRHAGHAHSHSVDLSSSVATIFTSGGGASGGGASALGALRSGSPMIVPPSPNSATAAAATSEQPPRASTPSSPFPVAASAAAAAAGGSTAAGADDETARALALAAMVGGDSDAPIPAPAAATAEGTDGANSAAAAAAIFDSLTAKPSTPPASE